MEKPSTAGPASGNPRNREMPFRKIYLGGLLVLFLTAVCGAQTLTITDPVFPEPDKPPLVAAGVLELTFTATADLRKARILVRTQYDSSRTEFDLNPGQNETSKSINLLEGKNTIELLAFKNGEKNPSVRWTRDVVCSGKKCGTVSGGGSEQGAGSGIGSVQTPDNVIIDTPAPGEVNAATFKPIVAVQKASGIKKLAIDVLNDKGQSTDHKDPVDVRYVDKSSVGFLGEASVKLSSGINRILIYDPEKLGEKANVIVVTCVGDKCGTAAAAKADAPAKKITIDDPKTEAGQAFTVENKSSIDSYVTVAKGSGITQIQYDVIQNGKPLYTSDAQAVDASSKDVKVPVRLKFLKGSNTIRIYDTDHPGGENDATIIINCTGENCASDFNLATIVTNSQNTRVVVGLEQAGASSAKSETKPFVDFFFTTPLIFDRPKKPDLVRALEFNSSNAPVLDDKSEHQVVWVKRSMLANGDELVATSAFDAAGNPVFVDGKPKIVCVRKSTLPSQREGRGAPRGGFWGMVRLSSTPEQLTTTGVLPSNLVNLATATGPAGNLVQSFEFLVGVEGRLFTANGSFLSLIPGIKQKTRFYFAAGVGDISPLDATQENPKFFMIPPVGSSQRAEFERRYGVPKDVTVGGATTTPTFVAFVPLERDRFLRQWFAGFRLKTLYCQDSSEITSDCITFRNSFPAVVDFMIGQSESVTGGSFKRTEVDPLTQIVKTRQALVFRIDAFYPLPFREANFIYLYGTAVMKLGGNQNIQNFLVLDAAQSTPNINSPTVYVPPVDFMRSLQSNRDYYKIGVGINLTDFFNRNKPK